jgi:hypothetical protein
MAALPSLFCAPAKIAESRQADKKYLFHAVVFFQK